MFCPQTAQEKVIAVMAMRTCLSQSLPAVALRMLFQTAVQAKTAVVPIPALAQIQIETPLVKPHRYIIYPQAAWPKQMKFKSLGV